MPSPPIQRALISVSDKSGLAEFVHGLVAAGVEIFSTGGTRKFLQDAGGSVRDVAEYTGFPEMMDGRVKTLHPKIHGGLLCRHDRADDMAALAEQGIVSFELVVVNLYPFEQTIANPDVTDAEAIEQIDIGGPSMVRSSAKNHAFVTIATDPSQYDVVLKQIQDDGATTLELRRELAAAAFARTAEYDAAITRYFVSGPPPRSAGEAATFEHGGEGSAEPGQFPAEVTLSLRRQGELRYGENPHQAAAVYEFPSAGPNDLVRAEQLNGKELSYNNLLDLDAALAVARSLPRPGVAVLKHNNPCGAATAATLGEAIEKAWSGDPVSAFGSVLGVNEPVDAAMAEFLAEPGKFVEAIIAPDFTDEAFEILTTKPKWKANVRLLRVGKIGSGAGAVEWRQIDGGMLCQTADDLPDDASLPKDPSRRGTQGMAAQGTSAQGTTQWRVVTEALPTPEQSADLEFAWAACRHVKSNAIVLAYDGAIVGVGAGQMSRVDAVEIALRKAGERTRGAVLASDAFFPFDDSIHAAANAGIAAVIQPGGSRRDDEVIAACNQHDLPMVFTGMRHFRH